MIKLPIEQQWRQSNEGDIFASIWSSYNLDLTKKKGELQISPRMLVNVKSSDAANLGVASAFRYFKTSGDNLWCIAGDRLFSSAGVQNSPISEDATGGPTTLASNYSDLEIAFGYLYISSSTTRSLITLSTAGTFNTLANRITNTSGLHDLEYFRAQNRLYFVDDDSKAIGSIDSANTTATLGNQYTLQLIQDANVSVITWIKSTSNRIWIGTVNYSGADGRVYSWDGSQTSVNETYKLDSAGSLACIIKDDTPYIIDTKGRLLKFNGGTFSGEGGKSYLDRFPVEEEAFGSYFGGATNRPVHFNGMILSDKGDIQILVNSAPWTTGYPASKNIENFPSGVWEYTRETGLYHKKGVGYLTGTESPSDYGQQKLSEVGAISYINIPDNNLTAGSTNGTYILGAKYYTDATSTLNAIFYNDSNDAWQKAGYFVTPKIYATNIEDTFNDLYGRFSKLNTSGDKIVFKYRTDEIDSVEGTITWLGDDNVFNCTEDLSDFAIGDEVEILQGLWAGKISTILEIDGGYTIKTADTFTGASGTTGKARFQKWKVAGTETSYNEKFKKSPLNVNDTWIQFKVYIVKTGKFNFHDMILTNKSNILIN
jgi:hypothetical protein